MGLDLCEKMKLVLPLVSVALRHTCHHIKILRVLKIKNNNKITKPKIKLKKKIEATPNFSSSVFLGFFF
jgi:hypothetical protein